MCVHTHSVSVGIAFFLWKMSLPRSDYTQVGRGHDLELDMDMEYDSPPTSLMEAVFRAGTKISLGSSSTSTSTAVYDDTNANVGPAASTMKSTLRNGKSSIAQVSEFACVTGKSRV